MPKEPLSEASYARFQRACARVERDESNKIAERLQDLFEKTRHEAKQRRILNEALAAFDWMLKRVEEIVKKKRWRMKRLKKL